MKLHILLHRPQTMLRDQHSTTKICSRMNSTFNNMESTKQFTTGHFRADNEIDTVLLSLHLLKHFEIHRETRSCRGLS